MMLMETPVQAVARNNRRSAVEARSWRVMPPLDARRAACGTFSANGAERRVSGFCMCFLCLLCLTVRLTRTLRQKFDERLGTERLEPRNHHDEDDIRPLTRHRGAARRPREAMGVLDVDRNLGRHRHPDADAGGFEFLVDIAGGQVPGLARVVEDVRLKAER